MEVVVEKIHGNEVKLKLLRSDDLKNIFGHIQTMIDAIAVHIFPLRGHVRISAPFIDKFSNGDWPVKRIDPSPKFVDGGDIYERNVDTASVAGSGAIRGLKPSDSKTSGDEHNMMAQMTTMLSQIQSEVI